MATSRIPGEGHGPRDFEREGVFGERAAAVPLPPHPHGAGVNSRLSMRACGLPSPAAPPAHRLEQLQDTANDRGHRHAVLGGDPAELSAVFDWQPEGEPFGFVFECHVHLSLGCTSERPGAGACGLSRSIRAICGPRDVTHSPNPGSIWRAAQSEPHAVNDYLELTPRAGGNGRREGGVWDCVSRRLRGCLRTL